MARNKMTGAQNYPRIQDEDDKFHLFLDDSQLQQHIHKISLEELKQIIVEAIENANKKSSRKTLGISDEMTEEEIKAICIKEGRELFKYFIKYCGDPASTAHTCLNRYYTKIAREQFRNRLLQKQRMNSGWRYQYIAKSTANTSKRFISVSDINSQEADFNATIAITKTNDVLNVYVSVKNRINTMGGQDWPKAIRALEDVAKTDKNRTGPYICVFGIAMDKGLRNIKCEQKTSQPYSVNTEVWLSDFFWPFFSNYSYDEIIKAVLNVLIDGEEQDELDIDIPEELVDTFGECCKENGLLDDKGKFNDAYKLADLFCSRNLSNKKPGGKKNK